MAASASAPVPEKGVRVVVHLAWGGALAWVAHTFLDQVVEGDALSAPVHWLRHLTEPTLGQAFLAIPGVLFLLWSIPQIGGDPSPSARTVVAACAVALGAVITWSGVSEPDWNAMIGLLTGESMLSLNILTSVVLIGLSFVFMRWPSWWGTVFLHGLLFTWALTIAFPYVPT